LYPRAGGGRAGSVLVLPAAVAAGTDCLDSTFGVRGRPWFTVRVAAATFPVYACGVDSLPSLYVWFCVSYLSLELALLPSAFVPFCSAGVGTFPCCWVRIPDSADSFIPHCCRFFALRACGTADQWTTVGSAGCTPLPYRTPWSFFAPVPAPAAGAAVLTWFRAGSAVRSAGVRFYLQTYRFSLPAAKRSDAALLCATLVSLFFLPRLFPAKPPLRCVQVRFY